MTELDGNPLDIASQPGWKVIYFWSAECPCVKACETYSLIPLAEKYAGKVSFFAVDADGFDLAKPVGELKSEAAAHKLPYAVVLDKTHETTKVLDAQVTPECFLLDPENHIVYSGMPDDSKRFLLTTGKRGVAESYLAKLSPRPSPASRSRRLTPNSKAASSRGNGKIGFLCSPVSS